VPEQHVAGNIFVFIAAGHEAAHKFKILENIRKHTHPSIERAISKWKMALALAKIFISIMGRNGKTAGGRERSRCSSMTKRSNDFECPDVYYSYDMLRFFKNGVKN